MINDILVHRLITAQFPQWKDFPVRPVAPGGWDNRTFRLGEHMLVRMPSAAEYAMQVEKEHRWLPKLAPLLPLPISIPLGMGEPADGYPWRWSIYKWIEGDPLSYMPLIDLQEFAASLAKFLIDLQRIDITDGPLPGSHNFYRGAMLTTYDNETRQAIAALKGKIDVEAATGVWEVALAATYHSSPVWIHGDISIGNLLIQEGRLSAVIDFGMLAVGDPACDLTIAWTLLNEKSRKVFHEMLPLDAGTWARGRAWALWKALILAAGFTDTNAVEATRSWHIIDEILADHRKA